VSKPVKIIAITAAAILGLIILLILVRNPIAEWAIPTGVKAATGREVAIADAQVGWDNGISVSISDLRINNPTWAEQPHLLTASNFRGVAKFWPLLSGQLVLTQLEMSEPNLNLVRKAEGQATWIFEEPPSDSTAPTGLPKWLRIYQSAIKNGNVALSDAVSGVVASGTFEGAYGMVSDAERTLTITLKGKQNKSPFSLEASISAPNQSAESNTLPEQLAVIFEIDAANAKLSFDGDVALDDSDVNAKGEARARGNDLADLAKFLPVPLPSLPPYDLAANVNVRRSSVQLQKLVGKIGDTQFDGTFGADFETNPPTINAALHTAKLDFDDLAPLIGLPPASGPGETASPQQQQETAERKSQLAFLPDTALDFAALQQAQGKVTLKADAVESAPFLPLTSFDFDAVLSGKGARIIARDIGIAGGKVAGTVSISSIEGGGALNADISILNARLKEFFRDSDYFSITDGRFDAQLALDGSGKSIKAIVVNGKGGIQFVMRGGALSGLIIEGIGADIAEGLVLYIGKDAKVPVTCAQITTSLDSGILQIEKIVADTKDSVVYGTGSISLKTETLDLRLEADAKDFSLIYLAAPAEIKGPLAEPEVGLGSIKGIGLFEAGDAKKVDCATFRLSKSKPK
jgi:AsmA family protein